MSWLDASGEYQDFEIDAKGLLLEVLGPSVVWARVWRLAALFRVALCWLHFLHLSHWEVHLLS